MESSEPTPLALAKPEDFTRYLIEKILPYNLVNYMNKAIDCLKVLTTDFEKEDEENFYIEAAELLQVFAKLYHILVRHYPDAENHLVAGDKERHWDIAPVSLTTLAYQTRDFLQRHGSKLLGNKKSGGSIESWMEAVEEFVYSRGLT